ncbi:MAG: hypothetical protein GYB67_19345, partial [Chloroflexi bacterium]|nr:hypothetical protein [Chloroflexota bacterium]
MTATADAIKTLLADDPTLIAALPGGLHTFADIGRTGISRLTIPAAYDTAGYLRPFAVIKCRDEQPWGNLADSAAQVSGARAIVEIYLYSDGDDDFTALEVARERIYALLQHTFVGDRWLRWIGHSDHLRDPK